MCNFNQKKGVNDMPMITDEEYDAMTLWDLVKFILIVLIVIAIIVLTSGCATNLPIPCMECLIA